MVGFEMFRDLRNFLFACRSSCDSVRASGGKLNRIGDSTTPAHAVRIKGRPRSSSLGQAC